MQVLSVEDTFGLDLPGFPETVPFLGKIPFIRLRELSPKFLILIMDSHLL